MSLGFLLYATDQHQYKNVLQQLLLSSFDKSKKTDFLQTWAKDKNNWKNHLLEALCIIQAKYVIYKLGLDFFELQQRFLSSNQHTTSHIHQIAKLLFYLSEELTVSESRKLIDHVAAKYQSAQTFIYSDDGEHLEMYLIHWLLAGIIAIGTSDDNKYVIQLKF